MSDRLRKELKRLRPGPWASLWTLALAASLLGVGCADRNRDAVPDQTQTNMPGSAADRTRDAASNTAELGDNAVTTAKIKNALITDPQIKATSIDVDTKDDVVTLSGTVATEAQKKRAGEIAKKHEGVKRVINNLVVKAEG
jgi:osmotically-inducible protein OsmY